MSYKEELQSLGDAYSSMYEAKDQKGKGSGSKDACYHKVKSRFKVWPSAYGSGALVKCRQAGADNWGNSSKKEEVEYMDEYSVSVEDGIALEEGKKECKDGYYYCKDEKKCKKKKKKESKTTVIVGRGYGGHYHDHDDDKEDNNDGGGDAGGGDGGGGGE